MDSDYLFANFLDLLVAIGTASAVNEPKLSKKIFIVHGHSGELKEAAARLVSQLQLEPVILHEQPKEGRTIIEQISSHAQEGGSRSETGTIAGRRKSANPLGKGLFASFDLPIFSLFRSLLRENRGF
jgi:hypothetical protein